MARSRSTNHHRLADALNAGDCPLFVVDDQRRIVFWNEACERWTRVAAESMIGQTCVYQAPDALDAATRLASALAAALCPPPESLSGRRRRVWREATLDDGLRVAAWIEYLPIHQGGDEGPPVLALVDTASAPPVTPPVDALPQTPAAPDSGPDAAGAALSTTDEPSAESLHLQLARFRALLARRFAPEQFVGADPRVLRARAQAALAARGDANVMIVGPRGVGKEFLARAIHYARHGESGAVWAPLACSTLGPELLWSTLEALIDRRPPGDRGTRGTLLLNEVDEMPIEVQGPLADLLQSGGLRMRVIGAGARSLVALAAEGKFDGRLANLLSTLEIAPPPLAERPADLPLVCQALVEQINAEGSKQLSGVAPEALDLLAACPWPGNVAELAAALREAHARAEGTEIKPVDLPNRVRLTIDAQARPPRSTEPIQLEAFMADVERELIERALRRVKGNKSRAAKLLGLTRPRLYRRMAELGLADAHPD